MDTNVHLVVVKGDKVFTFTQWKKLARDPNLKAVFVLSASTDFKVLKKEYPQATLREYADSRLSNKDRAMVDEAERLLIADSVDKPPLGIMPKWLADEKRLKELGEAMDRYRQGNKELPQEWVDEFNELQLNKPKL